MKPEASISNFEIFRIAKIQADETPEGRVSFGEILRAGLAPRSEIP